VRNYTRRYKINVQNPDILLYLCSALKSNHMSLDITLTSAHPQEQVCVHCGHTNADIVELYSANITHNLNAMAEAVGIYEPLWRPKENGIKTAAQLIDVLTLGVARLRSNPDYYKTFDSPNGWGTYKDFVPWVEALLAACIQYPDAIVEVDI